MREEKEKFLHNLKATSVDSAIVFPLCEYFESSINSIYTFLGDDATLTAIEKEKAVRSLVYFIKELGNNMARRRPDLYDIPGAIESYKNILNAVLYHKPLLPLLKPMGTNCTQLMAAAFTQYNESSFMNDVATYKRVASSPEFILQFLESKPGFRYADSLLLAAAAHDPLKIVFYLDNGKPGVQQRIRNTDNIYLKEIASLSGDKHASELMPFLIPIAQNKITPEEVLGQRTEPLKYFQLLVNTLLESTSSAEADCIFVKPLRNGVKQKALAFYVNEINELHSSSESIRFASVKDLRREDIYYIITTCGDELYTSSYLGLYKRLMERFSDQSADSLFDVMHYDNFRTFIRLAANYNVLSDFLHRLSPEKRKGIVQQFIAGIENDEDTGLERAMDIADSFTAINEDDELYALVQTELQSNLSRCTSARQYLGVRLYGILADILDMVKQKDGISKLWETLGDYELLKRGALENGKGDVIELVLFYGDEDGVTSFSNFLRSYTDKSKWEISKNQNWVQIRSRSEHPLIIYANRPLDIKEELDIKAQDSLLAFLREQSLEPTIFVHRGHSYHLDKTLRRLTPSVRLAILGSCGGYNKAISFASINSNIQLIGSKKTGSKAINDPIIDVINETLVNNKDLLWPEVWTKLEDRFRKDGTALSLFNEYFPPSHNLSLFVLKLFNYYSG